MKAAVFIGLIMSVAWAGPCFASEEVQIERNEPRMKAKIAGASTAKPGRRPNLLYRGAGGVAKGAYYAVKIPVDAMGRGTDFTVQAVQNGSYKIYTWISSPLHKNQ